MTALFTTWEPDEISDLLHTGFLRFGTDFGVHGLAKESENNTRIDILAVQCDTQGAGLFRRFLLELRLRYKTVLFLSVFNPTFAKIIEHYGFTPEHEILATGEPVDGWRWDAPKKNT
jgi:hypothetical protein